MGTRFAGFSSKLVDVIPVLPGSCQFKTLCTMKYLFLLLTAVFGLDINAQNTGDPNLSFQEIQASLQNIERAAFIEQAGDGNQFQLNADGNQVIAILQAGASNDVFTDLSGDDNKIVTEQTGNQNHYELLLDGQSNRIKVLQQGNTNTISQDLQGVTNLDIEFSQFGDGHEIIHEEFGISDMPISIVQQGSPMKVIVTSGGN